jgi:hypothetical protein
LSTPFCAKKKKTESAEMAELCLTALTIIKLVAETCMVDMLHMVTVQ